MREAATICHRPCDLDLLCFDLESGVQVTCDVGYLCANFGLRIGISVLDLGPMYATDRRQTSNAQIIMLNKLADHAKYVQPTFSCKTVSVVTPTAHAR